MVEVIEYNLSPQAGPSGKTTLGDKGWFMLSASWASSLEIARLALIWVEVYVFESISKFHSHLHGHFAHEPIDQSLTVVTGKETDG